jgi:hypothetical protein
MKQEPKDLSEAERVSIVEELSMPIGELFAPLFGAMLLLLLLFEVLTPT